jgi:nitrite reductase (NAD(P)H)
MGVDVASFGDFFREKREIEKKRRPRVPSPKAEAVSLPSKDVSSDKSTVWAVTQDETKDATTPKPRSDASAPKKRHGAAAAMEGPIETLTYRDPFAGVYKK